MKILEQYAMSFLGKPYIWGGDDPSGFDCSGLVIELLQSCGLLPYKFDTPSQGLHDRFINNSIKSEASFGALAFFGKSKTKITHVGFMIDNFRMIEAGGGGKHIKTLKDAIKYNAFIRIRPVTWRKDLITIIKPKYSLDNKF